MFGSGLTTVTAPVQLKAIAKRRAIRACYAAVHGPMMKTRLVQPTATNVQRRSESTTTAYVWQEHCPKQHAGTINRLLIHFENRPACKRPLIRTVFSHRNTAIKASTSLRSTPSRYRSTGSALAADREINTAREQAYAERHLIECEQIEVPDSRYDVNAPRPYQLLQISTLTCIPIPHQSYGPQSVSD